METYMTSIKTILTLAALVTSSAFALPPIKEDAKAMEVAYIANNVLKVDVVKAGGLVYKIVEMDSALNSDLTSTVMVLVGTQSVGGAAGFDAAFQVGPEPMNSLKSVKVVGDRVELTGYEIVNTVTTKTISIKYIPATKELSIR